MRKLRNITIVLVASGLLVAAYVAGQATAPVPAKANHVTEPHHPIVEFELKVEDYAGTAVADCAADNTVIPVAKVRVSANASMSFADWQTGDPSEHFAVWVRVEKRTVNPKTGVVVWTPNPNGQGGGEEYIWEHQNIPPHTDSSKFNTMYGTSEPNSPNGGSSTFLAPGEWRVLAKLHALESGTFFGPANDPLLDCRFTVGA